MTKPYLQNALLRCTRQDDIAGPVFDLTRDDLGLWVLELSHGYDSDESLAVDLDVVYQRLLVHKELLPKLESGSFDYTLHITYVGDESARLMLPPKLMLLAAQSGFQIEVYRWDFELEGSEEQID